MTDKELIKQEIEETLNGLFDYIPSASKVLYNDFTKDEAVVLGKYKALEDILKFIDSLPEEPASKDLEEASIAYSCANPSERSNGMYDQTDIEWAFEAGAEWQKQEMMKDAVELRIVESFNPVGTENEKPHGFTALCYNAKYPDFYPVTGQIIKIIPIKTEQQNEM